MIDRIYLCPEESNAEQVSAEARRLGVSLEIGEFAYSRVLDTRFDEAIAYWKAWSQDLAYPVTLHGSFLDMYPGSPDPKVRALAHERFQMSLKAAAVLGAKLIVFHTGYNPMLRGPGRLDGWLKRSAELWVSVMASSPYHGTIVVENMWEPSPEPIRLLCEAIDRPDFAACIDTGHINVFSRVPVGQWVDELAPHLRHLHIADNHSEWDEHLAIGEGTFNFGSFFSLLDEAGVGPVGATLEMTEPAEQVASYEWLKSRGFVRSA